MLKRWLTVTLIGLFISLMLLFNYWGLSVILITGSVVYMVWDFKKGNDLPIRRRFLFISGYSFLLSGVFLVTTVPVVRFFAGVFLIILLIVLGFCETQWRWTKWFAKVFVYLTGYLTYYTEYFKRKHKLDDRTISIVGQVVIGLIIALPILTVAVGLLSSADAVFSSGVNDFVEWFGELGNSVAFSGMDQWLVRVVVFLVITPTMYGAWFYFSRMKETAETAKEVTEETENGEVALSERVQLESNETESVVDLDSDSRFVPPIVSATILTSLNMIYLLFAYVQIRFLYMGEHTVLEGYNYADYAREGFFELVFLSLLNTMGILFINRFSRGHVFNRISLTITVGCTFIMMASSYYKMYLYESAYGYTQLRLYVYLILVYMFVFMSLITVNVWNLKFRVIEVAMVVGLLYFLVVSYVNIDVIVAQNNISRYETAIAENDTSIQLDVAHLLTLSEDSAHIVIPYIESHPELLVDYLSTRYDRYVDTILSAVRERDFFEFNIRYHNAYNTALRYE